MPESTCENRSILLRFNVESDLTSNAPLAPHTHPRISASDKGRSRLAASLCAAWSRCSMRTGSLRLRREEGGVERDVADVAAGNVQLRKFGIVDAVGGRGSSGKMLRQMASR